MARTGWIALTFLAVTACGGEDGGDGTAEESCQTCADNGEVCVVNADGEPGDWAERCEPRPAECTGDDPCAITECVPVLYDLCDEGYIATSNSCSGAGDVSVTCSPDA